jgi:hypothetical protein
MIYWYVLKEELLSCGAVEYPARVIESSPHLSPCLCVSCSTRGHTTSVAPMADFGASAAVGIMRAGGKEVARQAATKLAAAAGQEAVRQQGKNGMAKLFLIIIAL